MRSLVTILVATIWLAGGQTMASEGPVMERVKTGILPSGDFYSIYEVVCQDDTSASIARLERGRRWCATLNGELNCVDEAVHATDMACAGNGLAWSGQLVERKESSL